MHALCAMPAAQTNRIFKKQESRYNILKNINFECDERVSSCFFELLEMFETGVYSDSKVDEMIMSNTQFAEMIVNRLIETGFVESPDTLRRAVQV
jgi:hypothetical protein